MMTKVGNQGAAPRTPTAYIRGDMEVDKRSQTLQKRAEKIREILANSPDIVDISDEARELAATASVVFNTTAKPGGLDETKGLATREEREETAKRYDKVLEDLRAEYGEEEAMRRFDKFMRDEGYEVVTDARNGGNPTGGLLPGMRFHPGFSAGVVLPPNGQEHSTSGMQTYSSIRGAVGRSGDVEYLAETYANYGSHLNRDVHDALAGVYEKNMAAAQKGASFDLKEYMTSRYGSSPQTSAVSASASLGTVAADLLQRAGVTLGEGENVHFGLHEDGSLFFSGQFDEAEQKAIENVLASDPGIARAFKAEYDRVAMTDASSLAGAYSNGSRGVEYGEVSRSFIYSASEPSAVVMTDNISVRSTGYNYQKKVSDSFDINADMRMASDGGVNLISMDFENAQKVNKDLQARLNAAAESGEAIASTLSKSEYDAIQKARGGGLAGAGPNASGFMMGLPEGWTSGIHYAAGSPEAEKRAAEAKQALQDLEADPRTRGAEIAYTDEKGKERVATAAKILRRYWKCWRFARKRRQRK